MIGSSDQMIAALLAETTPGSIAAEAMRELRRRLAALMPELSCYTVVSVVALVVDLVVFRAALLANIRASEAGVIGYTTGMALHYVLSKRYVFAAADASKGDARRFVEFVLTGCCGLAITWSIIFLATEAAHAPPLAAKVLAVGLSFVVVFLLRRGIVFARRIGG